MSDTNNCILFAASIISSSIYRAYTKSLLPARASKSTSEECDHQLVEEKWRESNFSDEGTIHVSGTDTVPPHEIRVRCWKPLNQSQSLIGVVIVSHGLHEHGLRYCAVARALADRGFVVFVCDHYGHGLSGGVQGLIEDFQVLVKDFVDFGEWVRRRYPSSPLHILSHSMGTLVAILAASHMSYLRSVVFSATPIFAGPLASSPFGMTSLYPLARTSLGRALVGWMAAVAPRADACPIAREGITSDAYELEIHDADKLMNHKQICNKTAFEFTTMIDAVKERGLAALKCPLLCLHGGDDLIALPAGSQYIFEHAATSDAKKEVRVYPSARHELFHEVRQIREESTDAVINFFLSNTNQ